MSRPVSRAEAETLVVLYNRVTARCPNVPRDARGQPVGRKVTETAIREAIAFLRFCQENAFDPQRFIIARHEALGWRTRVPLKDLAGVGDNFVDHFRAWGDAQVHEQTRAVQPVEDMDRLSSYSEQLKALYAAGGQDVCMVLPDTRGWHPASKFCQICRLADPCRLRLSVARRAKREAQAHAG